MTNVTIKEVKEAVARKDYSLSDVIKNAACMFDNSGYEVTWSVDGSKGAITVEGYTFDITTKGTELDITFDEVVKDECFTFSDSAYAAKRLFETITTGYMFELQAIEIVNKAATSLGLAIPIVKAEGDYFALKHMEDYTFHPAALKQFIKVVKRHESDIKATAATAAAIRVFQWYTKETGVHMYSVTVDNRCNYTLSVGKDTLNVKDLITGRVMIKSKLLKLEFRIEVVDDVSINEVMSVYADKIRAKALEEALLP